ncbi:cysteine proteinase [Trametopsis cervina]|nr:cysteine proteinase [Trametopsis cervina]
MLAAPLQPSVLDPHDLAQYRPVRDLDAFNTLLPPPIEFVEGSSSGTLAVAEGKYQPINGTGTTKAVKYEVRDFFASTLAEADKPSALPAAGAGKSLYNHAIETSWPSGVVKGCGLVNTGNTCFLNSALQCLLHTPPLLSVLMRHGKDDKCAYIAFHWVCELILLPLAGAVKSAFCMSCSMRELMFNCYKSNRALVPYAITSKLQQIAKHMRKGRQEDSHEFLRYAIDALQKSCLAGHPPKIDHKLAETTWVHKIFGGRLRSRVSCLSCGHNSDTFDSILDLSIDIYNVQTIRDALRKFVAVDHLKGADKYKCEKCKKHVTADKQFTIHDAPMVLTVHLKRFTPMGRKMAHPIRYDEHLSLQPFMSQGQHGPTYTLYGVICHAGGGPNSGHYYASIKDAHGKWYEMNDESVTSHYQAPLGIKNAYMLFYLRDKGQGLDAAIGSVSTPISKAPKTGIAAGMKRKKIVESDDEDDEDDKPTSSPSKFIGPLLPSPIPPPDATAASQIPSPDPQALLLKKKIAETKAAASASPVKPSAALQSLSQYAEDDDSEDLGEKVDDKANKEGSSSSPLKPADKPLPPPPPAPASAPSVPHKVTSPVSTQSFYASKRKGDDNNRKRKLSSADDDSDEEGSALSRYARTPLSHAANTPIEKRASVERKSLALNPYNRMFERKNPLPMIRNGMKNRMGKRRPGI